jgi:hypothetical protein
MNKQFKDKLPNAKDDSKVVLDCMEALVDGINSILGKDEYKPFVNSPINFAFAPYLYLLQILNGEIEKTKSNNKLTEKRSFKDLSKEFLLSNSKVNMSNTEIKNFLVNESSKMNKLTKN